MREFSALLSLQEMFIKDLTTKIYDARPEGAININYETLAELVNRDDQYQFLDGESTPLSKYPRLMQLPCDCDLTKLAIMYISTCAHLEFRSP